MKINAILFHNRCPSCGKKSIITDEKMGEIFNRDQICQDQFVLHCVATSISVTVSQYYYDDKKRGGNENITDGPVLSSPNSLFSGLSFCY